MASYAWGGSPLITDPEQEGGSNWLLSTKVVPQREHDHIIDAYVLFQIHQTVVEPLVSHWLQACTWPPMQGEADVRSEACNRCRQQVLSVLLFARASE